MLRRQEKRCIARRCATGALVACAGVAGLAAGEAVAGGSSLVPVPTTVTSIISVTSSIPKLTVPLPAPPPVTTAAPQVTTALPQVTTTSGSSPLPGVPKVTTTPADSGPAGSGAGPEPSGSAPPGSREAGSPAGASDADAVTGRTGAAERRPVPNRRPAIIAVRLDRGGRIEFVVYGRAPLCEVVGRFVRVAKRGVNRFTFAGRVAGEVLEPGIYTITLNRLRPTQRVRLGKIGVFVSERRVRLVRNRPLCALERRDRLPGASWALPASDGSDPGPSSGAGGAAVAGSGALEPAETTGEPAVPKVLAAVSESVGDSLDLVSPFLAGVVLGLMILGVIGVAVAWSRFWHGSSDLP